MGSVPSGKVGITGFCMGGALSIASACTLEGLGAEVFHQSASEVGGEGSTGFNIGAIINITDNHHILLSAGRDFDGPNRFSSYIAYQYTFGPEKPKLNGEKQH